jgi:hypothetical protein
MSSRRSIVRIGLAEKIDPLKIVLQSNAISIAIVIWLVWVDLK